MITHPEAVPGPTASMPMLLLLGMAQVTFASAAVAVLVVRGPTGAFFELAATATALAAVSVVRKLLRRSASGSGGRA